jgi:hypothetical protein
LGSLGIEDISQEQLRVVVDSGRQVTTLGPTADGDRNVLFSRVAHLRRVPAHPSSPTCSRGIRIATESGSGTIGTIFKIENPGRMFPRGSLNHVAFRQLLGSPTRDGYIDMRLKGVDFYTGERLAELSVLAHILIHLAFCKCLYVLHSILEIIRQHHCVNFSFSVSWPATWF